MLIANVRLAFETFSCLVKQLNRQAKKNDYHLFTSLSFIFVCLRKIIVCDYVLKFTKSSNAFFFIYVKGLPVYLTKKDRPVVKCIARNFDGVNLLFISNR